MTDYFKTIELSSNIPNNFNYYYSMWTSNKTLQPKIEESDYYIPYQTWMSSMFGK